MLVSDVDGDMYVDGIDLGIVCSFWLETDCNGVPDCNEVDFFRDGKIDFRDFSVIGYEHRVLMLSSLSESASRLYAIFPWLHQR